MGIDIYAYMKSSIGLNWQNFQFYQKAANFRKYKVTLTFLIC